MSPSRLVSGSYGFRGVRGQLPRLLGRQLPVDEVQCLLVAARLAAVEHRRVERPHLLQRIGSVLGGAGLPALMGVLAQAFGLETIVPTLLASAVLELGCFLVWLREGNRGPVAVCAQKNWPRILVTSGPWPSGEIVGFLRG